VAVKIVALFRLLLISARPITEEQSGLPPDQKGFSGPPGKKGMDTDSLGDSYKQATAQPVFL